MCAQAGHDLETEELVDVSLGCCTKNAVLATALVTPGWPWASELSFDSGKT